MRARSILLLTLAIVLAGGTAWLAQKWLTAQRAALMAQSDQMTPPKPARSVLIARTALSRGQILRPEELIWQVWPDGALDKNYIELGGPRDPELVRRLGRQEPDRRRRADHRGKDHRARRPRVSGCGADARDAGDLGAGDGHLRDFRVHLPGGPGRSGAQLSGAVAGRVEIR